MQQTILHVITDLGSGGAEAMLTRLVTACNKIADPRQIVVSLVEGGVYGDALRDAGIEAHCLRLHSFWHLPAALYRLIRLMRREQPSVVITWLYHADLIGIVAAITSGLGPRRVVWNLRCSNIDLSNYHRTTRWIVTLLVLLSPLPWGVAANSRAGKRAHEALGYRPRRWIYLPNGLDPNEWRHCPRSRSEVRAELGLSETAEVVGMVARLDLQKDHATFLSAAELLMARHPETRFLLIGRDTETVPPREWLLAMGERNDVPRLMSALDIAVLCSAYGEGSPNAIMEAMAAELPCVVTDVGDAPRLIGGSGIVVPSGDPQALAEAISVLISEGSDKRIRRGRRARKMVFRKHEIEGAVQRYRQLWETCITQRKIVWPNSGNNKGTPIVD